MTRFARPLFFVLAVLFLVVVGRLAWTSNDRDGEDAALARTAGHGVRVAAQMAQPRAVPVDVAVHAAPLPAPAVYATDVERRFASAGASRAEIDMMKTSWPDWRTRFAGAGDDMVQAHVARVRPLVPVHIPGELSHVAAVDVDGVVAGSIARNATSVGDDLARVGAGGASVLDDVARGGSGVIDDVARVGATSLDDVLRMLGLGGAAGGAAAAAAAAKKRKK